MVNGDDDDDDNEQAISKVSFWAVYRQVKAHQKRVALYAF